MKPIGCKYICNFSVSQIFFQLQAKPLLLQVKLVARQGRNLRMKLLELKDGSNDPLRLLHGVFLILGFHA
jgi:hypothetical protein